MGKHTPGPWHVDLWNGALVGSATHAGGHHSVWAASALLICPTGLVDDPEALPNARLIAAAPELLEACKQAAKLAWEVGCETEDGVHTLLEDSRGDLYRKLSAAIAKAEGK